MIGSEFRQISFKNQVLTPLTQSQNIETFENMKKNTNLYARIINYKQSIFVFLLICINRRISIKVLAKLLNKTAGAAVRSSPSSLALGYRNIVVYFRQKLPLLK